MSSTLGHSTGKLRFAASDDMYTPITGDSSLSSGLNTPTSSDSEAEAGETPSVMPSERRNPWSPSSLLGQQTAATTPIASSHCREEAVRPSVIFSALFAVLACYSGLLFFGLSIDLSSPPNSTESVRVNSTTGGHPTYLISLPPVYTPFPEIIVYKGAWNPTDEQTRFPEEHHDISSKIGLGDRTRSRILEQNETTVYHFETGPQHQGMVHVVAPPGKSMVLVVYKVAEKGRWNRLCFGMLRSLEPEDFLDLEERCEIEMTEEMSGEGGVEGVGGS
ncbi:hypothetical protein BJ508DRAFT_302151 [Ascobolus immersus RN42]|uniref:Uncharacterized protein n=1 Tax=Ascobolus immersus RN42 TaxID=1160509 RepID=A0A3N4IJC8_ASCIM|nr:hypothetical protein BJ508DRAFT_302151 [Ascobolus immersus RN42]